MLSAQNDVYGNGIDHPRRTYMWVLKSHYYGSHFTTGPIPTACCSAGLYAQYKNDPAIPWGYDNVLESRNDTAEQLGQAFGRCHR